MPELKGLMWTNIIINVVIFCREDYDVRLNQISVSVHFGNHYTVLDGVLMLKQVNIRYTCITLFHCQR